MNYEYEHGDTARPPCGYCKDCIHYSLCPRRNPYGMRSCESYEAAGL
jgi:hypothetical protein